MKNRGVEREQQHVHRVLDRSLAVRISELMMSWPTSTV
jgi:hypothetical protein